MKIEVRQRLAKARRLVRIARTYSTEKDPEGVAHHAYYAMYNATAAVLLDRDGEYPKTHGTLVGRFGLLVKDLPGDARNHGRALREAYELRLLADYDAGATGLGERARASLEAATVFVKFATVLIARSPSGQNAAAATAKCPSDPSHLGSRLTRIQLAALSEEDDRCMAQRDGSLNESGRRRLCAVALLARLSRPIVDRGAASPPWQV